MNSEKQSTNLQMTLREVNRVGEGQKNVPKLRFKGYEDAWEQRKLEDIADVSIGEFVIKSKQNDDAPYPVFNGGKECTGYYDEYNNEANKIVISARGANAGFVNIVEKRFWAGNSCYSISIKDEKMYHLYFLYQFIKFRESLFTEFQQAANIPSVSKKDVLFFSVEHPLFEEQNEIGNFYRDLDSLITLHQRKYDALKSMKKTILSKMLPKDGEDVPEIRFKGFADAWEQRKLGEVGTTYTGLSGKTKEDFGHGNGQFVTYMNVFSNAVASSEMVEPVEIDERQNKVVAGDVLFTTSSETPEEVGMSSVWLENSKNTYLNSFCFGYRPIIPFDPYYLAFMLRSSLMRKKITFLAQGISRYNISKNKMMDIEIPVPIMSEQHQIGEYFRNLDYLITLHQRKLEELKNMKKTLLQQMFV